MKKITQLLLFFAFISNATFGQTTETFEDETAGSTSFTDNGQTFNITSTVASETYDIESISGAGWSGSANDNKFIDNSFTGDNTNNGTNFTIKTNNSNKFTVKELYLFCSTKSLTAHSGTLTITGKLNGNPTAVFTITKNSGFANPVTFSPNNGYTHINFSTEGGVDNSNKIIDELIFSGTGNLDYLGLDAFKWDVGSVNTAPVATAFNSPTVAEDATNVSLSGANISDAQAADTQTVTVTSTGGTITIGGSTAASVMTSGNAATVTSALNSATFSPTPNYNGAASISIISNDGTVNSNTATVNFTVSSVNDEPSFTVGANQTVNENAGAQNVTSFATALEDGDSEVTQTLSFNVTNNNNGLFSTQPAINASGNLTYTAATNAFGIATVTVNIMDNGGTTNPGDDDTSDDQTFTITVNQVNNTPIVITSISDDTGASTTDYITNDNTPTVNGTAEPGSTITLVVNGTSTALYGITATTNSMGVFAFPFPAAFGTLPDATAMLSANSTLNSTTLSSSTQAVTVDTTDPAYSSATSSMVAENTTGTVFTVTTTDATAVTYAITGGADQADLSITLGGLVTFNTIPDFENPVDSDTDNAYIIDITATDLAGNSAVQTVTLSVINGNHIWAGVTADWSTPSNWNENLLPTTSDNIIIPNVGMKPVITSGTNAVANNITIDASSSLTINTGGSLTMEGDLNQNGTFTINSDATSNGSLIVKGTHSGTGTVDYARYLSTSGDALKGWHLISSPVNGKNIDEFFGSLVTNGNKRGVAPYVNTNAATFKWEYYLSTDFPGFFTEGKGYTMKKSTAGTLTFNGFLNTNNAGISIEVKATGDQFNAIGNPYTSYINSGLFLDNVDAGRLTEKTIWLWDEAGNAGAGEYITTNSATAYKVAPGQGFFVKALATGNVTFSEAIQTHVGGDTFLREESKPEIKLSLTDGTNIKSSEIFYIENKTTGFDDGYDSSMFNGVSSPFAVYTQLVTDNQGKNLAIQTLPDINYENMVIPIGVNAESGKEIVFSLEASNFSSDMKIYLEDRSTNTFTRLEEANSTYTVTLTESLNGVGRFYLHTTESALSVDNEATLANISIYKLNNSTVKIAGLQQGKASIKLFNILGKQLIHNSFTTNGTKEISLPKLATGVYIVKLTTENGKLNKKIIIE
ncbi:T9SS type A sorting domain-containing protein [Polaribacter pectinis]|uniref:T9SS type A sorting domain-containing protein n=1 Tax=Polaribacter pectinis TaxID=2738844 RepID=A0A7G9L9W4_9FLAO|nr:T9SS type A sorting domain-containing protein [Polaribacter pectinis]QNM85413.1 T9SS type A sorting domain-containing protein [Polaribacter pectinis]